MLRESKELDSLLCTLLLAMGIEPWSKPQIGVRQHGVDLAATGKISDADEKSVLLFVVKQGNLGRNDWDSGNNAIRQSINEILDVFIGTQIPSSDSDLHIKIILCTGGSLLPEALFNWNRFTAQHKNERVSFDFWGADKLSLLIRTHLLNEFAFPQKHQKALRKTLAFLGDPLVTDVSYFNNMISSILADSPVKTERQTTRALTLVNFALSMLVCWASGEKNLKPAYDAAEHAHLCIWNWLITREVKLTKKIIHLFNSNFSIMTQAMDAYRLRLENYCVTRNSMARNLSSSLLVHLRTFDVMGRLALYGNILMHCHARNPSEATEKQLFQCTYNLKKLIQNNPISMSPAYDSHSIEICLSLLLFYSFEELHRFARDWINEMINKTTYSYRTGTQFPVDTDSFDDFLDANHEELKSKKELTSVSSFLPMLSEWCVIFNDKENYDIIRQAVEKYFQHTNLSLWYQDEKTEKVLYTSNAAKTSGGAASLIKIPESMEEFKKNIILRNESAYNVSRLSCVYYDLPFLALISSRHHRTPLLPVFWEAAILKQEVSDEQAEQEPL